MDLKIPKIEIVETETGEKDYMVSELEETTIKGVLDIPICVSFNKVMLMI